MAPSKTGKSITKPKKEKIYHPESRKAGQLARHAIRKGKLGNLATKRGQKQHTMLDVYGFFFHAIPEEGVLTLDELHSVVREIWMTRHDAELEEERAARRKGRPKSAREMKLEEIKLREEEEYRTGLEVPDLTHPPTVEIFRRWDQKEIAFMQLLRFIRISSIDPATAVVSRTGKHASIVGADRAANDPKLDSKEHHEVAMDAEPTEAIHIAAQATQLPFGLPPNRFSSNMMTMDSPLPSLDFS